MKNLRFAVPVLALAMLGTAGVGFGQGYPPQQQQQPYPQQQPYQQQQGYPPQGGQPGYPQGQPGYGERGGWDAPPNEMREFARQGFRDGIEGARRDAENHRRPNVNNRDEFRRPPVPREVRNDYRMGFRRGYDVAVRRMMGGGGNGFGPGQGPRPY